MNNRLSIYLVKSSSNFSLPRGVFNDAKALRKIEELGSTRQYSMPIREGKDKLFNCAVGTQDILSAGGVKALHTESIAPHSKGFDPKFKHGIRASQYNPAYPNLEGLVGRPASPTHAGPRPNTDVVLHQTILKKYPHVHPEENVKFQRGESKYHASDLYDPSSYVEHVLPIVHKDGVAHVADIRKDGVRLTPYSDFIKSEHQPGRVTNTLMGFSPK